jgi:hypothetical protein
MTQSNYKDFKNCARIAGGIIVGSAAIYFTTIYVPGSIIKKTAAATTAAMNVTLGSTVASLIPGTISDTAAIAGAEAYFAAKSTGFVGVSYQTIFGSAGIGYTLGSKAVEYTFTGMEKAYEGINSIASKANSWVKKINFERITKRLEVSAGAA